MQYRSLIHDYLKEQRPSLLAELEAGGSLGSFLDSKAAYLQERVAYLAGTLATHRPGSSPEQLYSEALELALADLLPAPESEASRQSADAFNLDAAIAFVRDPYAER